MIPSQSGRVFLLFLAVAWAAPSTRRSGPRAINLLSDRTLHIRSIPPVSGYNSHIYEVLMTPYVDKISVSSGRAVAELRGGENEQVMGKVEIHEAKPGQLQITGLLKGLTPGQHLGLSVHESGDCRQLGPIFRPDQPADAPPSPSMPAGFLGSTLVSSEGHVVIKFDLGPRLALSGHRSVLARGVALHALEGTNKNYLACGVLGRALPSPEETAAARRRRHFQHAPRTPAIRLH